MEDAMAYLGWVEATWIVRTRKDFQRLVVMRANEAKVLYKKGEGSGAYYLGGLAIECALKACIARRTKKYDFPNLRQVQATHSHDLSALLALAELKRALDDEIVKNS
jgi:hypothetical protein